MTQLTALFSVYCIMDRRSARTFTHDIAIQSIPLFVLSYSRQLDKFNSVLLCLLPGQCTIMILPFSSFLIFLWHHRYPYLMVPSLQLGFLTHDPRSPKIFFRSISGHQSFPHYIPPNTSWTTFSYFPVHFAYWKVCELAMGQTSWTLPMRLQWPKPVQCILTYGKRTWFFIEQVKKCFWAWWWFGLTFRSILDWLFWRWSVWRCALCKCGWSWGTCLQKARSRVWVQGKVARIGGLLDIFLCTARMRFLSFISNRTNALRPRVWLEVTLRKWTWVWWSVSPRPHQKGCVEVPLPRLTVSSLLWILQS